jgi:hypothetical protein
MSTVQLDLSKVSSPPIQEPSQAEYIQVALTALATLPQAVVTHIAAQVTPLNRSDLLAVCATGDLEKIKDLEKAGMVVDQEMLGDPQFLDSASPEKCLEVLKYLEGKGIDLSEELGPLLDKMMIKGDPYVEVVRFFIEKYIDDVDIIKNEEGETALVATCLSDNPQKALIALFLEKGADIYAKDSKGYPLLQQACAKKDKKVVALLLKKSEEYAIKFIEDFNNKFFAGHINGMAEKKEVKFNGGPNAEGANLFSIALEELPQSISEIIENKNKKKLHEAFTNAKNLTANDETVAAVKRGDLVVMPLGFDKHSIYLVFCNGYLSICNRGAGRPDDAKMLEACKIDKSKFSLDILQMLLTVEQSTESIASDYLYKGLKRALAATKDKVCDQLEGKLLAPKKEQKIGNCTYTSGKLGLRAATAMLHIEKEGEVLTLSNLINSKRFSKAVSTHVRFLSFDEYYEFHEQNPDLNLFDPAFSKEILSLADKHSRKNSAIKLRDYPHLFKRWGGVA